MNLCSASRLLETVSGLGNTDELIELLASVAKRADELARNRSFRSPQIDRETWLLAEAQVLSFGLVRR